MSALYQNEDKPLIQVNDDLWINPRAALYVVRGVRLSDEKQTPIELCLNGTTVEISEEEWAALAPKIVTVPAAASGCTCGRESVTQKSLIVQTVDEAIEEDVIAEIANEIEAAEPATDLSRLIQVVKLGHFVILDTETTGLNGDAEICQISIIDANGNTLLDTLVKPQKPIPADATRIHGITNDMVKDAPSWETVRQLVLNMIYSRDIVVYNAAYDRKIMHQSDEAGDLMYTDYKESSEWHCAMLAYAEYRGVWNEYHGNYKWHKLSDAAERMGYMLPSGMKAHSALADCLMTLAVCKKLAGL